MKPKTTNKKSVFKIHKDRLFLFFGHDKLSGFTLVELMFVVGFLATVVIGMIQLYIYTSVQANLSGNITLAIAEAQNKLEEVRNTQFDTINSTFTTGCVCADNLDNDGDFFTDFPADADCASQSENSESPGAGADPGYCVGSFDLTQLNGKGVIYIFNNHASYSEITPELLGVQVVISWQDKYNRIIGEDSDLDGVLDAGEDKNGNGRLDSLVNLFTTLTSR